jgi:hypothetical protein
MSSPSQRLTIWRHSQKSYKIQKWSYRGLQVLGRDLPTTAMNTSSLMIILICNRRERYHLRFVSPQTPHPSANHPHPPLQHSLVWSSLPKSSLYHRLFSLSLSSHHHSFVLPSPLYPLFPLFPPPSSILSSSQYPHLPHDLQRLYFVRPVFTLSPIFFLSPPPPSSNPPISFYLLIFLMHSIFSLLLPLPFVTPLFPVSLHLPLFPSSSLIPFTIP